MDIGDEYRAFYEAEHARRTELNSAIDRPITLITAVIGALYFSFSGVSAPAHPLHIVQVALAITVMGLLVDAVIKLTNSFYNNRYAFVSTAQDIEKHRKLLEAHHAATAGGEPIDIDGRLKDLITQQYVEAASHNAEVNEYRNDCLHRAKKSIIWMILVTACVVLIRLVTEARFIDWLGSMSEMFR